MRKVNISPHFWRVVIGLIFLFSLIAWRRGLKDAGVLVACAVAAYLIEFHALRIFLGLVRRNKLTSTQWLFGICAPIMSGAIVYAGYGVILVIALGFMLIADAVIVRFR